MAEKNIINELQRFEKDQLDEWYELSVEEQQKFERELVSYFEQHRDEFIQYTKNLKPNDFSTLSIIYEALSVYSYKFNDYLLDEIKRVITLALNGEIKPRDILILEDIEMEDIAEKDYSIYQQIIDFLISSLNNSNSDKMNISILELLDYYLIDSDDNAQKKQWDNEIQLFLKDASEKVKKSSQSSKSGKTIKKLLLNQKMFWQLLLFLGLFANILTINYFSKTIIDLRTTFGIAAIFSVLGFAIFYKVLQKVERTWLMRILYSLLTFGGLGAFLFLILNFEFASELVQNEKIEIQTKLYTSKNLPRALVKIDGIKKQIKFPIEEFQAFQNAEYIEIQKSKGLFGYEVIKKEELE